MHFCVIAPTRELDRYGRRSTTQLCLAQYARGSDPDSRAYFEWYHRRAREGDTVILDNGAYEQAQWNPDAYLQLVHELRPQVVTLPDKVGNWAETVYMIRDFAGACRRNGPDRGMETAEHMIVVQQHPEASLFEWASVYHHLVTDQLCDWIAFPRILGERRIELIEGLHTTGAGMVWSSDIKHHAFGMNAGSLDELPKLNSLGIYSCDSSAPVWRGLCGYHLNGEQEGGLALWPDIPFNPHEARLEDMVDSLEALQRRQLADRNLAEVLNACQSRWDVPSIIKAAPISVSR